MIMDHLAYADQYQSLHPQLAKAFAYLREQPLAEMAPGKYEIEGDNMFLLLQSYPTKSPEVSFWEAHERYMDIQYMVDGAERMGYACINGMHMKENFLREKDYAVLEGTGRDVVVEEGSFVIFFPQDTHMPCLNVIKADTIKKAVIKIKI
jgi:YhcH/YjgK/YiaL family protein